MRQRFNKTKTSITKKVISWAVGIPAGFIAFSEVNDLSMWWLPFVAMGALVLVLKWNQVFDEEKYQPKFVSRRSF
jgi:hypothetical protein